LPLFQSHAKINIGLRVLGKRADGFHNLESVFQEIDLCDEIRIEKTAGEVLFTSNEPSLPHDHRNLCLAAFYLLREKFDLHQGISLKLHKNIPVGSGLGGGSSNAAACLKAINEVFELQLSTGMGVKFEAVISGIHELSELNYYFYNDLEPVVFSLYPELADIKNRLRDLGAVFTSLTGSGSAVYGIFRNAENLKKYRRQFSQTYRTFIAKPVI
jgi:4-diphosphocytidyl-2C-methyl-D-erythritol kinase